MRSSSLAAATLALLLTAACSRDSGQTGSAGMAAPLSCVCASLVDRMPIAGTVTTVEPSRATLRIDRFLNPDDPLVRQTGLEVGDVVGGNMVAPKECGLTRKFVPGVGESIFAAYSLQIPPPQCLDAGASCDACTGGSACTTARAAALTAGEIVAVPVGAEIDFGDGVQVPANDLGSLADFGVCSERFPARDH